ncbi:unnamed protein product [Brassica oleracea]
MSYSELEMLWEGIKKLCLRFFINLKKIPDLSKATSLNYLLLQGSESLLKLTNSIGKATKLYLLDMSDCKNIQDFPNIPDSILKLVLCKTGIKEIPPWIEKLFRLRKLIMHGCEKLKTISPNISKLENLEFLGLSNYGKCAFGGHNEDNDDDELYESDDEFEATIEWGPDFKRSWRLRSDLDVHYILQICLPEKAFTSPISLRLRGDGIKTIPDCITRLSGLIKLDVKECRELVALPPLPHSLQSLDAQGCASLKRIKPSFQNPNIFLNFVDCFNLEQKQRKLIQTSACKYAVLPGEEVPAHFTHRASSDSLAINLTPRPLPSSFRFKACILLSKDDDYDYDDDDDDDDDVDGDDDEDKSSWTGMSCSVRGNQNGRTVGSGSNQLHMPDLYEKADHLYIFEDSCTLNQDFPEAEETTFSELTFVFRVHDETCNVKGCGVRLLEANNESAGGGGGGDDDDDDDDSSDHGEDDDHGDEEDTGGDGGNNKAVENDDPVDQSAVTGIFSSAFRFATSSPPLSLCDIKASAQEQI